MSALVGNVLLYWGIAVVVVIGAAVWQAGKQGLDAWTMYLAGLFGFGVALLLGGTYVYLTATVHLHDASFGRGVVGALLGAGLGAWLALRIRSAHFLSYADAAAPAVALGYAVYRIGCLINGCCFGTLTDLPWAITFDMNSEAFAAQVEAGLISADASRTLPVHPTQLYHALLGIVSFLVLLRMKVDVQGRRFAAALMLYGAGRFVIQFYRGDSHPIIGSLDINHIAALLMLVMGAALWRFRAVSVTASKRGLSI